MRQKSRTARLACAPLLIAWALTCPAQQRVSLVASSSVPGTLHRSLQNECNAAISRGLDWLAAHQKDNGSWSNGNFPALTALPLQAFVNGEHPDRQAVIDKAVAYLTSCVQEDGGIYRHVEDRKGGGLSNYNTSICMTALHATGKPSLVSIIQDAREFVAGAQHFGGDIYDGGFGYDRTTRRAYTDLLNTYYTSEAMRRTQDVEDKRPASEKRVDVNWEKTLAFVERMQNKAGSGDEQGGFVYNPTDPKAGVFTNAEGSVVFRSYGSITYAGLLAMIYAEVSPDDPRVVSALDWAARHWTLEENPGMGEQGLFFFYNILTKALAAAGRDVIPLEDGTLLNWREAVARKIVSLQKIDPDTGHGFWVNDTGRFWENDPVLATSYCLIALQKL